MLLARMLINRYPLKYKVLGEAWFNGTRFEDGVDNAVFLHAPLDQVDSDIDPASHLNRTTEGDLAVSLRPVNVSHGQTAALDVYGKIHL